MYVIAVCDDEEKELDEIESFLARYQEKNKEAEFKMERFTSGEALVQRAREENYTPDILLLDIFMPGKTGIEAAEDMRELGFSMPIVFFTTSTEYALKAYGVDAVQYLVKPLGQECFFHAMDSAIQQVSRKKESQIAVKISGGLRQIWPDDIIYCESQKNYQVLYLFSEKLKIRMTTGNLWEILKEYSQIRRCGRAFILNMNHIVSMEREEITMDNKSTVYISRSKVAEFKKEYFSYYFDTGAAI